jgi:hypothetical protein
MKLINFAIFHFSASGTFTWVHININLYLITIIMNAFCVEWFVLSVLDLFVCNNETYWSDRMSEEHSKLWNSWKIKIWLYKPCLNSPLNNYIQNPPLPTKRAKILGKFNERFHETLQPLGQRRSNVAGANDAYHRRTIYSSQSVPLSLIHCYLLSSSISYDILYYFPFIHWLCYHY